jgi:hypothetical protein
MDDAVTALFPILRYIGYPDFKEVKVAYEATSPDSP